MSKRHHSAAVRAHQWDEEEVEHTPARPRGPAKRELDEDYDLDYDDYDYKPTEKIRRKSPHRDRDWN